MKCVECEYFKVMQEPVRCDGNVYDAGLCKCEKHNLVCDFVSTQQKNNLVCVEVKA